MNDLPRLGDPVALRDAGGLLYASRIEGIDDDEISVARPDDLRAALEYDLGMELEVVWTEASGIHVVPTTLAGMSTDNRVRLWQLTVTGDGWTEQRRDYVRVPLSGRIVLDGAAGSAGASSSPGDTEAPDGPIEATFVDLSEVAAQVRVELAPTDGRIAIGRAVSCRFAVGGDDFVVDGTIIISRAGTTAHESRLVVRFSPSRAASDALRKHVFRIQVERRREQQG